VLHGAFADASDFAAITRELRSSGYTVHAPASPRRSLHGDANAIAR
jgi:esterase/lipase